MEKTGIALTKPTNIPVKLCGFTPSLAPRCVKGFASSRRKPSAAGRLPSKTTPIEDTTAIASSIGAMPGMGFQPQKDSTAAKINPIVTKIRIPSARIQNPFTIFCGIFHNPINSRKDAIKTGILVKEGYRITEKLFNTYTE